MKDFSPKEKCPKCREKILKTFYCKGSRQMWSCRLEKEGEHLHRICERCKYEWPEKCLKGGK